MTTAALNHRIVVTETLAEVINRINRLDESRREVLSMLPRLADEEIVQARMSARALGVWSWVIECACDAELMKRVEAKRGRGNKDVAEKGKVATINKHAYLCGQQPATVYRNAQIYKTFKNVLNDQNNLLEDKGFYEAALRTPEPTETLEKFAKAKDSNAFFSVRDAYREAEKLKRKKDFHSNAALADRIFKRIDDGCFTAEAILKCGECGRPMFDLDIEEVKLYMQQLVTEGRTEWRRQGGETDVARGSPAMLCVPKGTPAGSSYSAYRPVIEYDDEGEEHF